MKALIYTLLFIIGTHVLVLDAVHHEHDAGPAVESQQLADYGDVLDQGGDHCCQCHGFMADMAAAPDGVPEPASQLALLRPPLPDAPPESPYRPPIA